MKPTEFKKLIKEAVKEAIQEELKEILLEAVRAPKTVVNESIRDTYAQPHIEKPKQLTADRKSTRLNSSHVSESRMPSSA